MGNVFRANGDACGSCQAMDGTAASAPAHDGCACQCEADDDCSYDYTGGGSNHHGPGEYDATFGTELTVTCASGEEIGESLEIDLSGFDPRGGGDVLQYVEEQIAAAAAELCAQCPGPEAPNVS